MNQRFTRYIDTHGQFVASYVFESKDDENKWLENALPKLIAAYGNLTTTSGDLDGLVIGDECCVLGEGADIVTITGIHKYTDDYYAFNLSNGCREEVRKCYKKSSAFDMIAETTNQIEYVRLASLKGAVYLQSKGMKHSKGFNALAEGRKVLGLTDKATANDVLLGLKKKLKEMRENAQV